MNDPRKFAASILRASATAYGSAAASMLLERDPETRQVAGPDGGSTWRVHLAARIVELAAAIDADVPQLFVDRVQWTRKALRAREENDEHLLASLDCLRQVLDAEAPDAVRAAAMPALAAAIGVFDEELPDELPGLSPDTEDGRLALSYLLNALEGRERRAMDEIITAVNGGKDVRDILVNVLMPVQSELGQMWHGGELGIAQEHYVTATTERLMAVLAAGATPEPDNGRSVLLAAVSGDGHVVGVRAMSYLFELAGWRAVYLGGDVPGTHIAAAAEYFDVDLILLSATLSTNLPAVESTIRVMREAEDRHRPVVVGGQAYRSAPDLWQRQGADGVGGSAEATLALADTLTATS